MSKLDTDFIKMHLRISHSLEDDLIKEYIKWAKDTVTEAIFDKYDHNIDHDLLETDVTFQRAVAILTTYYYENRVLVSEVSQHDSPYAVLNAIQSLRGNRHYFLKSDSNED